MVTSLVLNGHRCASGVRLGVDLIEVELHAQNLLTVLDLTLEGHLLS